MANPNEDKDSPLKSAASGVGMMVLAIIGFIVALWVLMALIRVILG